MNTWNFSTSNSAIVVIYMLYIYISIPMRGRTKETCWVITKISLDDNQREVLNMIQLLLILSNLTHQTIMHAQLT